MSPDRDQREQAEERGRGAQDCQVRPLALCLDAKMRTDLLECGFHPPTRDEACEDHIRLGVEIGAEKCLRFAFAGGIANQYPADRCGDEAGMVPHRDPGGEFQPARLAAGPFGYDDR